MRNGEASRQRILDLVTRNPGATKSQICRELNLGWGTVSHHLAVLRRQEVLTSYAVGKEVRVFAAAIGDRQARYLAVLGDGPAAGIVAELRDNPGSRLVDLCEALGVSRKVIRRHLTVLGGEGILVRSGEARPRYALHDGGQSGAAAQGADQGLREPKHETRLDWSYVAGSE